MEDPGPEGLLAYPHGGFIQLQDGAGQQAAANVAGLGRERRGAVLQQVGQRAFADVQPEQVGQQPCQPCERDRLSEAQIENEGAQIRPERRARLQPGGAVP